MSGSGQFEQVRAAEVIASMCLATDLSMGFPFEHGLEATLVTMRLADTLGERHLGKGLAIVRSPSRQATDHHVGVPHRLCDLDVSRTGGSNQNPDGRHRHQKKPDAGSDAEDEPGDDQVEESRSQRQVHRRIRQPPGTQS